MTIAELTAIKDEIEKRFTELQDESKRLQGEHRLLIKLIGDLEVKEKEQTDATNNT